MYFPSHLLYYTFFIKRVILIFDTTQKASILPGDIDILIEIYFSGGFIRRLSALLLWLLGLNGRSNPRLVLLWAKSAHFAGVTIYIVDTIACPVV